MALVELDEYEPAPSVWPLAATVGAVLLLILVVQGFVIAAILAIAP